MSTNNTDLDSEEARLEKQLKDLRSQMKRVDKRADFESVFDSIFEGREIYYVQEHDKIYEYNREWQGSPWALYDGNAFRNEHPSLRERDGWTSLMEWLRSKGNYHHKATYSFKHQSETILNRMRTDHWLKPSDGEFNQWYDTLMLALGGDTEEGKNHLEQLLVWKYNHPEDFLLPCVNWFDEGGVGKNLFVDGILGTIFGAEQVGSVGLENLTGQFNSIIKGKTIILMNEAANRKVDMEKFKNMIGQPDLYINEKNIPQYRVDNTALYFIATNDPMSIPVEGKKSDRRWSLIHLHSSIEVLVARELNCSELDAKRLWVDKFAEPLKDPENLSAWLGHLLKKWKGIERPQPLHGDAYETAVGLRDELNPVKQAFLYVNAMTTWVPVLDLYLYTIGATEFHRGTMWSDYKKFCAELANEIKKRRLSIVYEAAKKHRTRGYGLTEGKPASASIIRCAHYHGPFTAKHFDYSTVDISATPTDNYLPFFEQHDAAETGQGRILLQNHSQREVSIPSARHIGEQCKTVSALDVVVDGSGDDNGGSGGGGGGDVFTE